MTPVEYDGERGYGSYPARHCPGCGVGLSESERCSIPGCPDRGKRRRGGTLTGTEARTQLESQFADPPERRAMALEHQRRRHAAADGVAGENEYLMWRAARLRAEA